MAYAKFRADNMHGTHSGADLVSLKYLPSNTATAIENGNVVVVGAFISGSEDVRSATTPAANSALNTIAIIGSEEVVKSDKWNALNEFRNEAGAVCRGYRLGTGSNIFSVSAEAITGTAAVGSIIELQAGTKLKAVSSATSGSTKVGTVIALEGDWIVIESI